MYLIIRLIIIAGNNILFYKTQKNLHYNSTG
ncbi:hypothetical protein SAMN05444412_11136 [Rhodonellum ikkaensis]|uniref:Uncharacterized protein n=1 Tax=Rhodonellum ikkaensis TaxID=336829 RepID=A0A1H3SB30_9BACT|nr:hypothetical protein SAMN05444412_11136 [Rhodonellum ikkaensis]